MLLNVWLRLAIEFPGLSPSSGTLCALLLSVQDCLLSTVPFLYISPTFLYFPFCLYQVLSYFHLLLCMMILLYTAMIDFFSYLPESIFIPTSHSVTWPFHLYIFLQLSLIPILFRSINLKGGTSFLSFLGFGFLDGLIMNFYDVHAAVRE